jgi:hypothetical protein
MYHVPAPATEARPNQLFPADQYARTGKARIRANGNGRIGKVGSMGFAQWQWICYGYFGHGVNGDSDWLDIIATVKRRTLYVPCSGAGSGGCGQINCSLRVSMPGPGKARIRANGNAGSVRSAAWGSHGGEGCVITSTGTGATAISTAALTVQPLAAVTITV